MSAATPPRGPLGRVDAWLDERIGHRQLIREMLDEPVTGGARWAYVFGSALTLVFVLQLVTGLLLMTVYAPSATTAWASVHYISNRLAGGWIIRGLHHFGSQAMVVLLGAHLLQVAIFGAYKRPREMNWFLGLALLAVTLGFSLTGYLLPWDQKGYWATRVATNIAGTTPGIGAWVQQLMQGGPEYGSLTLTRFYSLHVGLLPLSLLALVGAHIALFRKHGVTPAANADLKKVDLFYPRQVWKDLVAVLVVTAVMFYLALREHGAQLDAPADPASDYPARPEWYFLPLFQLLKYFQGPMEIVGTMGVPAIAGAYLVLLPFFDKAPTTALGARIKYLAPLFAGFAGVVVLLVLSIRDDDADTKFQKARKQADARAEVANKLAMNGVPPAGPLQMLAHDPELRGHALFARHCASCHVLGDLGDAAKATASKLDGWGTEGWVASMMDDPDALERFGHTPFKGMMPSMLHAPADRKADDPPFKPMADGEVRAVAVFLASQSDGSGGAEKPPVRLPAELKAGESIVTVRCTTCHLWKGEGDDSSQGFAPDLSGWGTVSWVRAQIANPATKTTYRESALDPKMKGHMPRFDGDLPADDLDLLAKWVQAHAHGRTLPPAD
ncbi:MAG: cytochrome b N-terminal domain-containing protein [Polyangiaceae bacterium]|jgi:ubiquinol-cytochrome c reductase cytochrome b subunit